MENKSTAGGQLHGLGPYGHLINTGEIRRRRVRKAGLPTWVSYPTRSEWAVLQEDRGLSLIQDPLVYVLVVST